MVISGSQYPTYIYLNYYTHYFCKGTNKLVVVVVVVVVLVSNVVFSNKNRYSESLIVLLLSHRSAVLEGKEIQTDLNQKLELPLK